MPHDNNNSPARDIKRNNVASDLHYDVIGASGVVTLNRPDALNALNHDMVWALHDIFTRWKNDPAVLTVIERD